MTMFAYRGYSQTGTEAKGLIEAMDAREARERLSARGILPEHVEAASAASRRASGGRFGDALRAEVYGELGVLLESGLTLGQALDLTLESPTLSGVSGALAGVKDRVRDGRPFAEAIAAASPRVTAFECAVIESGERTGSLGAMLLQLGDFLEGQVRIRERVLGALTYPLIVLGISLAIALGVVLVMLPSLREMIEEADMAMPALTRIMLAGGQAGTWLLGLLAVSLPMILLLLRVRLRRSPSARRAWDRVQFRLPLYGPGLATLAAMRFCRTLALMLKGGVPLVQALPLAGKATGNRWLESEIVAASQSVRDGESLARAVQRIGPFAYRLPGWIQAGEAGGQLEPLLSRAADRMQHQWERRIQKALALFEPLLIIAVGVFVFLLALAVLLPILSLNAGLQ